MTAGILVCGLVAVASVFSFAIRTNAANRQMAIATTLLYNRMEEFRSSSFTDPLWTNAFGTETLIIGGERYTRVSEISIGMPRSVTVKIYAESNALMQRRTELIRATTLISPTF